MRRRAAAFCLGLALCFTLPLPVRAQPMTLDAIIAASDAEVARAHADKAQANAARGVLINLAEAIPGDAPAPLRAYPYLAIARTFHRERDYRRLEAFGAATAQLLDAADLPDHPYRIEALILQAIGFLNTDRADAALFTLRPAVPASADLAGMERVHRLGAYYLALAGTRTQADDAGALRAAYRAVHDDLSPLNDADLLVMEIEGLSLDSVRPEADPQDLARRSRALLAEADRTGALTPYNHFQFRMMHGRILLSAGALDDAIEVLSVVLDQALNSGGKVTDYISTANSLARAHAQRGELSTGAAVLEEADQRLSALSAEAVPDRDFALLLGLRAGFTRALGDNAGAQALFRRAYAVARRSLRRSDRLVARLVAEIDPDDPGMRDFPLRDEFVTTTTDVALDPFAVPVLRAFWSGQHAEVKAALDRDRETAPTALLMANLAYLHAMSGRPEDADATVQAARDMLASGDKSLSEDAPILDFARATAILFGSTRPVAAGAEPLSRLAERRAGLSADQSVLLRGFEVFAANDTKGADHPEVIRLSEAFEAEYNALPTRTPVSDFGAMMASVTLFDTLGEDRARAILDEVRERNARAGGMNLLATQLDFDRMDLTADLTDIEDRISQMAAMASELAGLLPQAHPLTIWNLASVADELNEFGYFQEGADWIRSALALLRDRPGHPDDMQAWLLHRLAIAVAGQGDDREAATLARQAYDLIDPDTARPWAAYPVILGYAIERPSGDGDWRVGADVIQRFLDNPGFVARMDRDKVLYMDFIRLRLIALDAPPEETLREVAAFTTRMPDDDRDRRDTEALVAMMRGQAHFELGQFDPAWSDITVAMDLDRNWRRDTYGALAQASGLSTAKVLLSLEADIGWSYAEALKP